MPKLALLLCTLLLGCAAQRPAERPTPDLGLAATAADIARVYWTVFPDGENLPPGSGNATQGAALFRIHCQHCHGVEGAGKPADRLVGGQGTLGTDAPMKTIGSYWPYATTVFNYIRRAMPFTAPMSLSSDDYYALTAYLLERNEIIAPGDVMNATSLPRVRMPNRNGFVNAHPRIPPQYDYGHGRQPRTTAE
jgi:mono/diheme cytochrome c family protein